MIAVDRRLNGQRFYDIADCRLDVHVAVLLALMRPTHFDLISSSRNIRIQSERQTAPRVSSTASNVIASQYMMPTCEPKFGTSLASKKLTKPLSFLQMLRPTAPKLARSYNMASKG